LRIGLPCLECILDDVREAAFLLAGDETWAEALSSEARAHLKKQILGGQLPSEAITQVHRLLKSKAGVSVLFKERRERTNRIGITIAERVKVKAKALAPEEKFYFLARWAIAGNALDFRTAGAGYKFDIEAVETYLKQVWERGLARDDSQALRGFLSTARRLLYVLDNVGESALDQLFIEECLKPGRTVIAVVRGGAITSDVVLEDAVQVGLDRVTDKIVSSGSDTLGILWEEASPELKEEFKNADLVIAKGQANYYLLSEPEYRRQIPGRVACLFTTKCDLVAGQFEQKGKVNILTMV
jgi:hypothetical protein